MSDLAAVYILQYLEQFKQIVNHHCKLYNYLIAQLQNRSSDITVYPTFSDETPFVSCLCLFSDRFNDAMIQKCLDNGVYCRKYYTPLVSTPTAAQFINTILCLPCTKDMTTDDIDTILSIIN